MHTAPANDTSGDAVIVVDDDEAVLASLRFSLAVEGFKVTTFRSEDELAGLAEWPRNALLLIDLNLGGRDGLDLLATLRRQGVASPAVLMTSQPTDSVRRRAAAAGVEIVEKPIFGNALVDTIRRVRAGG